MATISQPNDPSLNLLVKTSVAKQYEISVVPRFVQRERNAKTGRTLNLVLTCCANHINYKEIPRQVKRLIAERGLPGSKYTDT